MTIDKLKQKLYDEKQNLAVMKAAIDSDKWKRISKEWGPPTLEGWQALAAKLEKEIADLDAKIKKATE